MKKKLGKIRDLKFGLGGYQDCQLGLSMTLDMKGSCVGAFVQGGWAIDRPDYAQWTEVDRAKQQADLCTKLISLMKDAGVDDVMKLEGVPVEVTIEGNALKDWRILTEVL